MKFFYSTMLLLGSLANSFAQAPIAHFPLDNDLNSTVEGVSINLQATGEAVFTYTEAHANNGLQFDGTGVYSTELNNYLSPNLDWTLSLWCLANGQASTYATIFESGESIFLRFQNNNIEFGYYNGTDWYSNLPQGAYADGLWHHYALRYDTGETGTSLNLIIDGQTSVSIGQGEMWSPLHNMCVFGTGTNDSNFNPTVKSLLGIVDDIQIFPLYLSDSEVINVINSSNVTHTNENLTFPISIYPNPTTEWVSLDIPTNLIGASVSVVNINGQVVLHELAKAQKMNMNVASLAIGNYTVVVSDGITSHSSTLIKQ